MAGSARRIVVEFIGEDRSLSRTANSVDGKLGSLGSKFGKVSKLAGAAGLSFGAVAVGVYKVGQAASDLAETQSKVTQIFGKESVGALNKFAKGAAASMGQSRQSALDAAATFGMFGKMAGLAGGDLVGFSTKMTGLASDMASFNNSTPQEAIDAIGAALRGEAEPIRRFGVLLDDATLKSQAMKMGIIKTTKEALTPQQKVLAAQAAILAQTKDQQGDFARTSDGLANKQRILAARFENIKIALGKFVVPWLIKGADAALLLMNKMKPLGDYLRAKLGPIFAKVGGFLKRMGKDGEDSSSKFGQMVASIRSILKSYISIVKTTLATIAAFWKKYGDDITRVAKAAFGALTTIIGGALEVIAGIFKTIAALMKGDWKGAWDGIKMIASGAVQMVKGQVTLLWTGIKAAFSAGGSAIKSLFTGAWNSVKSMATSAVTSVVNTIKSIPDKIKALGSSMLSAGKGLMQKFLDGIASAKGFVSNFASNVWAAIKKLLNSAIDKINTAIPNTLGKGPLTVDIDDNPFPHFATGGIVKGSRYGTPIIAGDGGHAEAIVPLSGPHAPRGMGGSVVNIYVSGAVDAVAVGRQLEQIFVKYQRSTGRTLEFV